MADLFGPIAEFINSTQVLEQIRNVQVKALFTNGYFLIPFLALIIWWVYKIALKNLIITGLIIGLWIFSGSPYCQNFIIGDELQLSKVLPVVGVGVGAIAVIVYLFFIRSD